jgi:ADP-ribose pyrophosphatase YjhB (NUDIX family)
MDLQCKEDSTSENGKLTSTILSDQPSRGSSMGSAYTVGTPISQGGKKSTTCHPSLQKEAKSTSELTQYTFTPTTVQVSPALHKNDVDLDFLYDNSCSLKREQEHLPQLCAGSADKQQTMKKSLLLRTESRQGRDHQRWITESDSQQRVRLVTGCVPILTGGRILFVSASRKPEWILPKGGWEQDETMEESALREAYEEAGVLGTLGLALEPVQYETRKSKKRRNDMTELLRKYSHNHVDESAHEEMKGTTKDATDLQPDIPQTISLLSDEVVNSMRELQPKVRSDETSSNASDSSSYSFVRLTMFPLYVSEVRDSWPESSRFRKIVHIDEAIQMLESREELRSVLIQVKEKSLHIISQNTTEVLHKEYKLKRNELS